MRWGQPRTIIRRSGAVHHTAFRAPPGRRVADDEPIRWRSGDSNPRTQSRPAFIHAKASRKESFCSASALHDVASQAIKNLPHLRPMTVLPLNRSRWGRRWSSGHVTGTTHRLRYGQFGSSDHMWRHISGHVTAPDVDREVWPVLGKALSKQTLQEQAAMRQPTPPRRSKCSRCCRRPEVPSRGWGAVADLPFAVNRMEMPAAIYARGGSHLWRPGGATKGIPLTNGFCRFAVTCAG